MSAGPAAAPRASEPSARFAGQTAVVTGGTRGLGRAFTLALLGEGARVHATWVAGEEAARSLVEEAGAHAGRLVLHRSDVADAQAVDALWDALEDEPEGVQVLVANAGIRRDAIVGAMPLEDWKRVLDVNLTGSFLACRRAVRAMSRRRYGRIVLVSSPSGRLGFAGQANYAASKAGQVALARCLALEVAKRGITVNCVSPGFVRTELLADLEQGTLAEHAARVPSGRFAEPHEVAAAVLFLASREASYVQGSVLEVSGGL